METVKRTIEIASRKSHVEITTLIIPGENDSGKEIMALSSWLADINPEIPLHISRFFPRWQMDNKEATSVKKIYHLADIARRNLKYLYEGNC